MKAAMRQVAEIKRLKEAMHKSTSKYLKRDYYKKVGTLQNELKEYCRYKGYDYNKIIT